jgi:hypothetical protein
MPRLKPRAHTVAVDGTPYQWSYRGPWVVDHAHGFKDVSLSVALEPGRTRELILDLRFACVGIERNPTDAQMAQEAAEATRGAIRAGWDPESRGRSFRYAIESGLKD